MYYTVIVILQKPTIFSYKKINQLFFTLQNDKILYNFYHNLLCNKL